MTRDEKEFRLHAAAVRHLRKVCPDCLIFHPANGEKRSEETIRRLKAMGVLPGVFDLVLMAPGARVFFLEAKTEESDLSDDQRWFRGELIKFGFQYVVFRSFDDLRKFIIQNNIPNRLPEQAARLVAA